MLDFFLEQNVRLLYKGALAKSMFWGKFIFFEKNFIFLSEIIVTYKEKKLLNNQISKAKGNSNYKTKFSVEITLNLIF